MALTIYPDNNVDTGGRGNHYPNQSNHPNPGPCSNRYALLCITVCVDLWFPGGELSSCPPALSMPPAVSSPPCPPFHPLPDSIASGDLRPHNPGCSEPYSITDEKGSGGPVTRPACTPGSSVCAFLSLILIKHVPARPGTEKVAENRFPTTFLPCLIRFCHPDRRMDPTPVRHALRTSHPGFCCATVSSRDRPPYTRSPHQRHQGLPQPHCGQGGSQ